MGVLLISAMKGDLIMQINFKAPDVYQVQAAPTNKHDAAVKMFGLGCVAAIVLGYFGVLCYGVHKMSKDNRREK